MPPAPLDAGDAGPQTSLPPEVSGAPRPPGRWEEGAPLRRTQSAAPGRRGGPPLTRFLTSADSPYEGPLLNCVELMAGARTEADRLAGGLEGPRPGAPPPPLIGPQRACPYKAGTLHSCGRPLPEPLGVPPPPSAAPHHQRAGGRLRQGGAGAQHRGDSASRPLPAGSPQAAPCPRLGLSTLQHGFGRGDSLGGTLSLEHE